MPSTIAKTSDGIGRCNTKIYRENSHFAVQLHDTVVYDENRTTGKLTLNNGGWVTPTTTRRINQALAHRGFSNRVAVRKGQMVLLCTRSIIPFDGNTLVCELWGQNPLDVQGA